MIWKFSCLLAINFFLHITYNLYCFSTGLKLFLYCILSQNMLISLFNRPILTHWSR